MISQDKIIEYFAGKQINVKYNTLGGTKELVTAYVFDYENIVKESKTEKSEHSKHRIYDSMYEMEPRTKLTGFEKLQKIDRDFRTKAKTFVKNVQSYTTLAVDTETELKPQLSYKETLKNHLKTIEKPLLYYSGGIDSELVALAMLDVGVNFETVIFELLDKENNIINTEELSYAYKFVEKHQLNPTIKQLNVEQLWESEEFVKLTEEIQLPSPQVITHAYMVKTLVEEFPSRTHMFGGEARFYTHHWLDDGRKASLVLLTKLVTPGYNTNTYSDTGIQSNGDQPGIQLRYYTNGTYDVYAALGGTQTTGNWASPSPTGSFEYRVTNLNQNAPVVNMNYNPGVVPTSWSTITATVVVCEASSPGVFTGTFDGTYTIEVRSVTTPANLVSSTITIQVFEV